MSINHSKDGLFMSIKNKIEISIAVSLVLTIALSFFSFGVQCGKIRDDVVRLHILANSDSDEDQTVKLLVRDALLQSGEKLFSGLVTKEDAARVIEEEKESLQRTADKVLKENGFDYTSYIYLSEEYFATREYENFTMPAGKYLAVRVILGEGSGHNWWCVMYPPLCIPAACEKTDIDAVLGKNGARLIESSPKYEMRFKVVELYEKLRNKVK